MFGDKAAYLEKFKTCVRMRPFDNQKLGSDNFYIKEHTKPIFNSQTIFTAQNLYHYHILFETFKIIKTHTPISIYSSLTLSQRKETLFIIPSHSQNFLYKASSLWNTFKATLPAHEICDFSVTFSSTKARIKETLLRRQQIGDKTEWSDENFLLR